MPVSDTTTVTLRLDETGVTILPGAIATASCIWRQYAHAVQDYKNERASERFREGQGRNTARIETAVQHFFNNVTQPLGEHLQDVKQHLLRRESVSRIAVRLSLEQASLCLPFFDVPKRGDVLPRSRALLCTLKRVALFSRSDNIVRWYFDPDRAHESRTNRGRSPMQPYPRTDRYDATNVRGRFELLAFVASIVRGGNTIPVPAEHSQGSSTCKVVLPKISASFHAIDTVEACRGLFGRVAVVCSISAPCLSVDAYSDIFQPENRYHFSSRPPAGSRISLPQNAKNYEWDVTVRLQPGRILFTSRDIEGIFVMPVTLFELPLPGVTASGIMTQNKNVLKVGVAFPPVNILANNVFRFFQTANAFTAVPPA